MPITATNEPSIVASKTSPGWWRSLNMLRIQSGNAAGAVVASQAQDEQQDPNPFDAPCYCQPAHPQHPFSTGSLLGTDHATILSVAPASNHDGARQEEDLGDSCNGALEYLNICSDLRKYDDEDTRASTD